MAKKPTSKPKAAKTKAPTKAKPAGKALSFVERMAKARASKGKKAKK